MKVQLHSNNNPHTFQTRIIEANFQKSSIFFKVTELFQDKLGIKIVPVPLDPFSKKPSRAGWNDPTYDPNTYSWARHHGNVGIIPGRSSLLIIDCDTEETVEFFKKLAKELALSIDTLIVKTRRGRHFYYYCDFCHELEKKQFSFDNIKLDILAGSKCQVVAPYSLLKVNENGEVLDPHAKNYLVFEYTPLNVPQKLVELTKEKYKSLISKLESFLEKNKRVLYLDPYVENSEGEEEKERHLTDEEIGKLVELVADYFIEGQRQNLILYLAGYLRKDLNVSEESIFKLYESLQPGDDPKDVKARWRAIKKTFEKDLNQIAGRAGLVEVLGEDTANELCNKIRQTLGLQQAKKSKKDDEIITEAFLKIGQPKNFVYVEINRKSRKFARCNYDNLTIEYGAFEKNEFTEQYYYVVHHKTFDCCIEKIYAIENPLTNEKKYEVHFISKNPEEAYTVLKGTLQEIWEELKAKTSYVLNSSVALNVLTAVFSHYLKQGWYEKKKEELPSGFYYIDGQIIAQGFEEKNFTKEELQKAALFLNEYINSHPNPPLLASIIRAGLLLPFSFAQKQMVHAGKLRQRMKYLFLYGETKSGKTTTATLLQRIWGWDYKISYASFNTEARAGKHLSSSTLILIVDEVSKDLETSTVKEILKYAQEDLIARSIQNKSLKQVHYPALASLIMTSNSHFPEDPALVERFYIFHFRKHDKISHDKRQRYEREDFRILGPLGQFVWKYIKEHGLKDDYINYATEILRNFYKEAEVDAEWLDWAFIHDTAETEEEQQYAKEAEFYNAVIKFFNQNVKPKEELHFAKSVYHALRELQFGRWIWVDDKNYVYISKDFLYELKKSRCNIRDLEELADLTGWERKKKRFDYSTIWVVSTCVEDFFYRLNFTPQLLSSTEFKEWLMGRLEVKHPDEEA